MHTQFLCSFNWNWGSSYLQRLQDWKYFHEHGHYLEENQTKNLYMAGLFKSAGAKLIDGGSRTSHNLSADWHAHLCVIRSIPAYHNKQWHTIYLIQNFKFQVNVLCYFNHTESFSSKPFNFPVKIAILILALLLPPLKMGFAPCTCLWHWQMAMESLPVFFILD